MVALGENTFLYKAFVFPGALLITILSGFKVNFFSLLFYKNKSSKLFIISSIVWGSVILFLFLRNNGYLD